MSNEPFISPWLIYLIGALSNFALIVSIVTIAVAIVLGFAILIHAVHTDSSRADDWEGHAKFRRACVKWIVGCVVALFMVSFIPSKETAAAMLIASKATPANYETIKSELIGLIGEIKSASSESSNE